MNERGTSVRGTRKAVFILNRILTLLIILALICTIIALIWVVSHPVEEKFTEFYILGPDGKAEGYPKELAIGEEGKVILGITNREQETMEYMVEMTVEGLHEKTIGPITLEHEETWEQEVTFIPHEASARTRLAEVVDPGTGVYTEEITSVQVESTEYLKAGDYIQIAGVGSREKEQRLISFLQNNTILFDNPLRNFHDKGHSVTETQKVEFKLYKIRAINKDDATHTMLTLWLEQKYVDALILNTSHKEAEYHIEVKMSARIEEGEGFKREESKLHVIEPASLGPGEQWALDFEYEYAKAVSQNTDLFIYRDGILIYDENTLGGYPALHLWITVNQSLKD